MSRWVWNMVMKWAWIAKISPDLGVEEQRVHSPWVGLVPPVQVLVARGLRELSVVLRHQVLVVGSVLDFDVVNVRSENGN